jgi:DNA-binding NtrC family response regulator
VEWRHNETMSTAFPTILVVDDDDDVRALAVAILHDAGYRPIPATNGDAAMMMMQSGLTVDLLFTDIVMPGDLDGFSLAYEAKLLHPDIKVLYTTGFAEISAGKLGRYVEGPMLKKPYRPATLASEVMRALGEAHRYEGYAAQRI